MQRHGVRSDPSVGNHQTWSMRCWQWCAARKSFCPLGTPFVLFQVRANSMNEVRIKVVEFCLRCSDSGQVLFAPMCGLVLVTKVPAESSPPLSMCTATRTSAEQARCLRVDRQSGLTGGAPNAFLPSRSKMQRCSYSVRPHPLYLRSTSWQGPPAVFSCAGACCSSRARPHCRAKHCQRKIESPLGKKSQGQL